MRFLLFCFIFPLYGISHYQDFFSPAHRPCTRGFGHWFMKTSSDIIKDTVWLHYHVLSVNSLKIITGTLPIYLMTRMADNPIHCHFYDKKNHKNIHQLPHHCSSVINALGHWTVYGLSGLLFIAQDEHLYTTARIFAIGAICGLYVKDFVKVLHCDANIRPWNEHFSRVKRSHGGFPSGHMFEVVYMATVWGTQYGLPAALPLGTLAALSFFSLVQCNRHYTSQVVAGAALGLIYGVAVNTLINQKLSEYCMLHFGNDNKGRAQITVSYQF